MESDFLGASSINKIMVIFKIDGKDRAFEAKILAKAENLPHEDLEGLDVCLLKILDKNFSKIDEIQQVTFSKENIERQ